MHSEKGFINPVIIIIAVVLIILTAGALYLFFQKNSDTTLIRPNDKTILTTKADPDAYIPIPDLKESKDIATEESSPESPGQKRIINSIIDDTGVAIYKNELFNFSVQHPKNYIFEEKIRNYYNIDSTEDPNELVYVYTLSNPELAPTGGNPGDKVLITVYQPGYEPVLLDRNNRSEEVTVAGQKTQKQFAREGKLITVGPLTNQGRKITIQYEMPNSLTDQTFFNAVLASFTFSNQPSE